jgi:hypothetical protein
MSISKAFGRIAEYKGNSCRIEVLAFKKNGTNVTTHSEIRLQFPPHGYVFAPKFFEIFEYDINTLVEFTTSSLVPSLKGENLDAVLMDINKSCKQVGFRVFHLPKSVMFNEQSFNQPQLKSFIEEELSHFYLQISSFLYGPFRSSNHDVIPKSGLVINKYKSTEKAHNTDGKSYILFEPDEILGTVDCMTQAQLSGFFKDQIRNQLLDLDFNQIKKALEAQPLQGLDLARMHRLLANLEALSLSQDEIKSLVYMSNEFKTFYQTSLTKVNDEIKKELITPFLVEKNKLELSVNALTENIKKIKKQEESCLQKLEKLQKDYAFLSSEKERLIGDIRAHALVGTNESTRSKLVTYEERLFFNQTEPYSGLDEFVNLVNTSLLPNENGKSKFTYRVIHQFKDHKCFLCNDIRIAIQIARLSNNCKLIVQQVEPDWLKFQSLYINGLEHIWRSAHNDPEVLHFFILEDLNIASIECYGRPLLDLVNGIRQKLPSTDLTWPANLWIFGVPIAHLSEEFGLPLIEETFSNWAAFPITDNISIDTEINSEKYLKINQLKEHSMILTVEKNQYFISR